MTEIPDLNEILLVLFMLVPGFLSFTIVKRISSSEIKFSEFELTILSIFLSIVIYLPYTLITGVNNLDAIRESFFFPNNLLLIIGLAMAIGIILGILFKIALRRKVSSGSLWRRIFRKVNSLGGAWVSVFTEKEEYLGKVVGISESASSEEKEIIIKDAKRVIRDDNGEIVKKIFFGKEIEILFTDKDIHRIVFYKYVSKMP